MSPKLSTKKRIPQLSQPRLEPSRREYKLMLTSAISGMIAAPAKRRVSISAPRADTRAHLKTPRSARQISDMLPLCAGATSDHEPRPGARGVEMSSSGFNHCVDYVART